MKPCLWLVCFVLILSTNLIIQTNARLNFVLKRFEHCDLNIDFPNKLHAKLRTVQNVQYMDANFTFRVPIANDLKSNFTIDLLFGSTYIQVIKFEEKHSCSSMHRYFGEFAYDLERTAQLVAGLCPIPVGRYHVHNYRLDFNTLSLQNFPLGNLRFTEMASDKNNKIVFCWTAEAENKS